MNQLDRLEDLARRLAPSDTSTIGHDQLTRIEVLLRSAVKASTSRPAEFLPGTGRLGGQGHDHDDTPPADPDTARKALADARRALHHQP